MSFELPKQCERCENCPRLTPYFSILEKVGDIRDQTLSSATDFMGSENPVPALREFLEDHEIILETAEATTSGDTRNAAEIIANLLSLADQSDDNVRTNTEDALRACDDVTERCNQIIDIFIKECQEGPKMKRRYVLFGRKVLKCGSQSIARVIPAKFLSRGLNLGN